MNPLTSALIGAAVRWIVTIAATHQITVSNDQATQIVSGTLAAAMLAWSFARKKSVDDRIKKGY